MYKLKGNIEGQKFNVKYSNREDFLIFLEEEKFFWELIQELVKKELQLHRESQKQMEGI